MKPQLLIALLLFTGIVSAVTIMGAKKIEQKEHAALKTSSLEARR